MSEIKLLPCPFCGGEAEYTEKGNEYMGISETMIKCKKCHTKQVHKWLKYKFNFDFIREKTFEAWNNRKPMDDIVERLEDLQQPCYECRESCNEKCVIERAIDIVKEVGETDGKNN